MFLKRALVMAGIVVAAAFFMVPAGNAYQLECDLHAKTEASGQTDSGEGNHTNETGSGNTTQGGAEPDDGGGGEPCTEEQIAVCLQVTSDVLDLDGDLLSERVEECFLGTSPLDSDTDNDFIPDGLDGTPAASFLEIPLTMDLAFIEQIYPNPNCDDVGTWDLYFSAYTYDLPALSEDIALKWDGWTQAAHGHDVLSEAQGVLNPFTGNPVKISGTGGTVGAGKIKFDLDPDLTKWNGGLENIGLNLQFGAGLWDHDHNGGYDDTMALALPSQDILLLGTPTWKINSARASDANSNLNCQARVHITNAFSGLTAATLDAANAREENPGTLIGCTHSLMHSCSLSQAKNFWENHISTGPYGP